MPVGDLALRASAALRESGRVSEPLDLVIVGAGPAGLVVAQAAWEAGLEFLLLERENLAAHWRRYPGDMTLLSTRAETELPGFGLATGKNYLTRQEAIDYFVAYARQLGLDRFVVPRTSVVSLEGEAGKFVVRARQSLTGEARALACRAVVLATGAHSVPRPLGVPGEDAPNVSRWFGAGADHVGEAVVIVGGGNSAVEAAVDLAGHGAKSVTMLVRSPAFRFYRETGDLVDVREGSEALLRPLLKEDSDHFRVIFDADVRAIERGRVRYRTRAGDGVANADWVYALTGYGYDEPLCGALGVPLVEGAPELSAERETVRQGVYFAGTSRFIQHFREDGRVIVAHALLNYLPKRRAPRGGA